MDIEVIEAELNGVERVLTRLDDGTFGTCEICAGPVDTDRDVLAVRCPFHT